MKKYLVRYSGSSAVRPINFEREERNYIELVRFVVRDLTMYYPAYYTVDLFDDAGKFIKQFRSEVMVREVK